MQTKAKNRIKISLDILMALVFAVLFDKNALGGIRFHEVAGLAVGAFIIIHMLLNRAWLKVVTRKLFKKALPVRTRIAYIVDMLLLAAIAVIIITGIMMSKAVFADLISVHLNVSGLHKALSYISLMLIGVHLGLSWNRVTAILKSLLKLPKKRVFGAVAMACAIAVFSIGSYNVVATDYFDKVTSISSEYSQFGDGGHLNSDIETPDGNANHLPDSGRGNGNGNGKMHGDGHLGSTGVLMTIYQNLSISGAFAVFVFYLDKLLRKKPKKTGANSIGLAAAPVE